MTEAREGEDVRKERANADAEFAAHRGVSGGSVKKTARVRQISAAKRGCVLTKPLIISAGKTSSRSELSMSQHCPTDSPLARSLSGRTKRLSFAVEKTVDKLSKSVAAKLPSQSPSVPLPRRRIFSLSRRSKPQSPERDNSLSSTNPHQIHLSNCSSCSSLSFLSARFVRPALSPSDRLRNHGNTA